MDKAIRPSEHTGRQVRDMSQTLPRVSPDIVAAALGAESASNQLIEALSPITLFAVRQEMANRQQLNGGRSSLSETKRQAKISLSENEWLQLESLAAAVAPAGITPSASLLASALLTLSVQVISEQLSRAPVNSGLARELANLAEGKAV
jgi:hypothetical protein